MERQQQEEVSQAVRGALMHQLVPTPIPEDMLTACNDLLEGVVSGEITGLGVVVVLRRRRFFVDCFGEMVRDPHGARGWVASLDDCLREIGLRKYDTDTTR